MKGEAAKAKGSAFQGAKPPGFMEEGKADDPDTDDKAHAEVNKGIVQNMQEDKGENAENLAAQALPPLSSDDGDEGRKDESDSGRHRAPQKLNAAEVAADDAHKRESAAEHHDKYGQVQPWSWLGRRSLLMTSTDEPMWVLERLMDALEWDLKEQGRNNLEQERKMDGMG